MSLRSESGTFYLPLADSLDSVHGGKIGLAKLNQAQASYIGDSQNLGLKYLADLGNIKPTDWPLVLSGPSGTCLLYTSDAATILLV